MNVMNFLSCLIVLGFRWCSIPSASRFAVSLPTPSISKNSRSIPCLCLTFQVKNFRNRRSQCGLAMINVTNRTDIDMRFAALEFTFCHVTIPLVNLAA